MPRRHMPKAEAARAVGRLLAGQTQREVAHRHGVSQSVIQRLWQKYWILGPSLDVVKADARGRHLLEKTVLSLSWQNVIGSTRL